MARQKIQLADNIKRVVTIETEATVGATVGVDLKLPSGQVATLAQLQALLGGSSGAVGVAHHRLLQGLTLGDDHPQYTRRDILTADGDLYLRAAGVVSRIALGAENTILRSVGGTPVWSDIFEDPQQVIGLIEIAGVGTKAMRSDAAPALDQNIAPTWTGLHTFGNTVRLDSASPRMVFYETDVSSDKKFWDFVPVAGNLVIRTRTDADGTGKLAFQITRGTTTAVSAFELGNATDAPAVNTYGTITLTNAFPTMRWTESDQAVNARSWQMSVNAKVWSLSSRDDAFSATSIVMKATRGTAQALTEIEFGGAVDNPTYLFSSSSLMTVSGHLRVGVDSKEIQLGALAGGDLRLYHDGTDSFVHNMTGALKIMQGAVEVVRFDADATAGNTRLMIYDVDNATLERVSVGAADSAGAGFKTLRIPN